MHQEFSALQNLIILRQNPLKHRHGEHDKIHLYCNFGVNVRVETADSAPVLHLIRILHHFSEISHHFRPPVFAQSAEQHTQAQMVRVRQLYVLDGRTKTDSGVISVFGKDEFI